MKYSRSMTNYLKNLMKKINSKYWKMKISNRLEILPYRIKFPLELPILRKFKNYPMKYHYYEGKKKFNKRRLND